MRRANDLGELSDGAVRCRAFGHSWANPHSTAYGGRGRVAGWHVTLVCSTCDTAKSFTLGLRGELSAPRYTYPDGYLATFFVGPDERGAMRLETLKDALNPLPLRVVG